MSRIVRFSARVAELAPLIVARTSEFNEGRSADAAPLVPIMVYLKNSADAAAAIAALSSRSKLPGLAVTVVFGAPLSHAQLIPQFGCEPRLPS